MRDKKIESSEIIRLFSNIIRFRRELMLSDGLYLDDVFMLSAIYTRSNELGKAISKKELQSCFNILSYRRETIIKRLKGKGFINSDNEALKGRKSSSKLILTAAGEQLLYKYDRVMRVLIEAKESKILES
jgi:predicted transcriptional regulator